MKFLTTKGAPNIPLELLEAQESKSLVFFCGAGVSYAAGLPGFSGLVKNVFEKLGITATEAQDEAIKAGLFDRALGLLEQDIIHKAPKDSNLVRKAIIEELTISHDADLSNHKAILQLSRTENNKYRLVTTNVDHGFLQADNTVNKCIDAAPKLPVPKPHRWRSIVHLHGIIDSEDPNGENLIFTSGDFGTAYLTERWASKFVTELFTHFTVFFIGYSLNDPVIRYMTDAIASERLHGYKGFKQPYVAAHTSPKKSENDEKAWASKGIKPILYSYSHNNLYNTLKEWDFYIRDGLNAKERSVIKVASIAPLSPYDQDPNVMQLVDLLSEKTSANKNHITGYPAKVFSAINDPPAPIDWLPVLYENNLLSMAKEVEYLYLVASDPCEYNLLQPNKISLNLWDWLFHYLENNTLIRWIIDNGVCLHPWVKQKIATKIRDNPPNEPYLRFWKIVTSDHIFCNRNPDSYGYEYVISLERTIDKFTLSEFTKLLRPVFILRKAIDWSKKDKEYFMIQEERKPYEVEVTIALSDWMFQELRKNKNYPKEFIPLLVPSTQYLIEALDLWSFSNESDDIFDRSHWDMPSIQDHQQNTRFRHWVILIEICRDLWGVAWEYQKEIAKSIISYWRAIEYPVFRRLVFYTMTFSDVATDIEIIRYLLEDNGKWMWASETQREVFRLLAVIWPKIEEKLAIDLIEKILEGPPRNMYLKDLSHEDWRKQYNRDLWLMLSKLKSFGKDLPKNAEKELQRISSNYPRWTLSENEKDEFSFWMETGSGYEVDISVNNLFLMDTPELVEYLSNDDPQYNRGRIDSFRVGCKENQEKAIEVLNYMADTENWKGDIWHAALVGLSENIENIWGKIAPLIVNAQPELYRDESWPIAFWTKKNIVPIKCAEPEEQYFWTIFNKILDNVTDHKNEIKDAINSAINHPVGIITEALVERCGAWNLQVEGNIPEGPIRDALNQLIGIKTHPVIYGKIILASRLSYFYTIDPEWTKEKLIPLFNLETSDIAPLIWEGYLWSPRLSADLAIELKEYLMNCLKNIKKISNYPDRLIKLFAVVCLEYKDLYSRKEQRGVLLSLGVDGLVHISEMLMRNIGKDSKTADNYWKNRIQPFIKGAWPRAGEFITEKTTEHLALMLIRLDDTFEDALDFLSPFIKPVTNLSRLLTFLKPKEELIKTHPKQVFKLLTKLFTENYQWPMTSFREVLNKIVDSAPSIKEEVEYRRMDDFLIERNL